MGFFRIGCRKTMARIKAINAQKKFVAVKLSENSHRPEDLSNEKDFFQESTRHKNAKPLIIGENTCNIQGICHDSQTFKLLQVFCDLGGGGS